MSSSPEGATVTPASPSSPSAGKLTFREKLAVGTGGMPIFFGQLGVKSMAVSVYQMLLGVNPAWLGVALAVPRLWDAFIDPMVGNYSDNFRSRWGRRRPFIVVGAVLMALAYGAIWMVSPEWSEMGKLTWLAVTLMVFYTCYALYSVAYQGLTYEMSPDYDERTRVMGHSSFWYKGGEFIYQWIFWVSQRATLFAVPMVGVMAMNWITAILFLGVLGLLPGLCVKERYYKQASHQGREPFWPALLAAMSSKPLLILIALTMLKLFANMVASSMDHYLLVYYVHNGNIAHGSYVKSILSSCYAVVGLLSIPALNYLCRRFGKKETILVVYVMVAVAGFVKWILFQPGVGWWVLLDPILSGPILVGITMVIPSMMADVCDEDELKNGQRREGMFGAAYLWIQKLGIGIALMTSMVALNLSGFDVKLGGNQSPETFFWMRMMLAGATTITAVIAIVVALFYPITRARAEETRRKLEARRGTV